MTGKKRKFPKVLIELRPSLILKSQIGVFAVTDIKKGQKISDGVSLTDFKHQIPWKLFDRLDADIKKKVMSFCVGTPQGFIVPDDGDFNKLSIEWYFNHSCDGNMGFNKKGDFVAIRGIRKGEEITYDYGLVETNPQFKMKCKCEHKNCRKIVTGNDWKLLLEDKAIKRYIHPYLKKAR